MTVLSVQAAIHGPASDDRAEIDVKSPSIFAVLMFRCFDEYRVLGIFSKKARQKAGQMLAVWEQHRRLLFARAQATSDAAQCRGDRAEYAAQQTTG